MLTYLELIYLNNLKLKRLNSIYNPVFLKYLVVGFHLT